MTLAELRAELLARGFNYLSDDRADQLLNWANHELDDSMAWPYREASVTGTSPLQVTDLGMIEAVVNTSSNTLVERRSYAELVDQFGDLSQTSTDAWFYYPAQPAGGTPEIATYPDGASIGVQYWRATPDLSADSDTPLSPSRFHHLIVDIAARRAYLDRDDFGAAQALQAQIDRDLQVMALALLADYGPTFVGGHGQNY